MMVAVSIFICCVKQSEFTRNNELCCINKIAIGMWESRYSLKGCKSFILYLIVTGTFAHLSYSLCCLKLAGKVERHKWFSYVQVSNITNPFSKYPGFIPSLVTQCICVDAVKSLTS